MNIGEIKDYDITVKVRNNYLLTKMRERGYFTAAALSRACGVQQQRIGHFLNLAYAPFRNLVGYRNGCNMGWIKSAKDLADFFQCLPEDLFPPQHIESSLPFNRASFEVSLDEVDWMLDGAEKLALPPDEEAGVKEIKALVTRTLMSLTPREERVLRMRCGFGGRPEMTAAEVANVMDVSQTRVQQIEAKALRKLRHPSRSRPLTEASDFVPNPKVADDFLPRARGVAK